jgi:hypothetical protein
MGNDQPAFGALTLPANRAFQNRKSGWSTRSFHWISGSFSFFWFWKRSTTNGWNGKIRTVPGSQKQVQVVLIIFDLRISCFQKFWEPYQFPHFFRYFLWPAIGVSEILKNLQDGFFRYSNWSAIGVSEILTTQSVSTFFWYLLWPALGVSEILTNLAIRWIF